MRRILLVDDHPAVRMGVRGLLLTEFPDVQIDEAESEAAALATIAQGPGTLQFSMSIYRVAAA